MLSKYHFSRFDLFCFDIFILFNCVNFVFYYVIFSRLVFSDFYLYPF